MRKSKRVLPDRNPPPQDCVSMRMMKCVKGEFHDASLQLGAAAAYLGAPVVQSDRGDAGRRLHLMVAIASTFLSRWRPS